MNIQNLTVKRIIIHQVFQREAEQIKAPYKNTEFTNFADDAMEAFRVRVVEALGEGSRAVRMQIVKVDVNSLPALVDSLPDMNDADFIEHSYSVATKLADAQFSKSIPGGIVVVFDGSYGPYARPFVGIIKAELHSGYEKQTDPLTGKLSLKYVEEILLTPSAKLYKTAGFFRSEAADEDGKELALPDKWLVKIADSQITQSDGKAAAKYFYETFLGCGYMQSAARTTKLFYETTKEFIDEMQASQEEKIEYYNALSTYLKVDQSPSINPGVFAETYFGDIETQENYVNYLKDRGIDEDDTIKDITFIKSHLKFRTLNFSKSVRISAPPGAFDQLISVETFKPDPQEAGAEEVQDDELWTRVIVKDVIVKQE